MGSPQFVNFLLFKILYSLDSKPGGDIGPFVIPFTIRNTLYPGGLLSRGTYFQEGAYFPDFTVPSLGITSKLPLTLIPWMDSHFEIS